MYDFRANERLTLRERPLKRADLDDFVECYRPNHLRHTRKESERSRKFSYSELAARDKLDLDTFWLKDDGHIDPDSLPPPDEAAAEIAENLEVALERFRKVATELSSSVI